MTNVQTWTERLRRELRKQWWQTLTVILAIGLGAGCGSPSLATTAKACAPRY